nr:hypothetical protein [Tanacetum cinerariifolium]
VSCANATCGFHVKKELCATLEHLVPAFNNESLISVKKLCPEEGWLKLILGHGEPLSLSFSSNSQPAPLMLLWSSGLTPFSLSFGRHAAWSVRSMTIGELVDVDMSSRVFLRRDGEDYLQVKDIQGVVSKLGGKKKKNKAAGMVY